MLGPNCHLSKNTIAEPPPHGFICPYKKSVAQRGHISYRDIIAKERFQRCQDSTPQIKLVAQSHWDISNKHQTGSLHCTQVSKSVNMMPHGSNLCFPTGASSSESESDNSKEEMDRLVWCEFETLVDTYIFLDQISQLVIFLLTNKHKKLG